MDGFIDLKTLSLDSLAGIVTLYPWFGAARKELCSRMSRMGGDDWGAAQYADAAMYIPSRKMIADLLREGDVEGYADGDVEMLLKSYISEKPAGEAQRRGDGRKVYAVGGDYFTQDQYDKVKGQDTGFRFVLRDADGPVHDTVKTDVSTDFYTETLAQIYAEQGYYEQAIEIYSKLILAYPEKNAYFAALIDKLNQEIKK
jgi:hypothetical protein